MIQNTMSKDIHVIQNLLGKNVQQAQLKYVDGFFNHNLGIFVPLPGLPFEKIMHPHTHPSYAFFLVFDPYCIMQLKDKAVSLQSGKVYILSPEIMHYELPTEKYSRYIGIFIKRSFFERNVKVYTDSSLPIFKADMFDIPIELMGYLKDFMTEYENKVPFFEELLNGMVLRITHCLIRMYLGLKIPNNKINCRMQIDRVVQYMNSHYAEKITLGEMAQIASLSPSHFLRIFKKETGKTPTEYLIELRLHNAKKMLRAGEKSMTQIALDCGFNSSSHFSSAFHKKYLVSPSQFQSVVKE